MASYRTVFRSSSSGNEPAVPETHPELNGNLFAKGNDGRWYLSKARELLQPYFTGKWSLDLTKVAFQFRVYNGQGYTDGKTVTLGIQSWTKDTFGERLVLLGHELGHVVQMQRGSIGFAVRNALENSSYQESQNLVPFSGRDFRTVDPRESGPDINLENTALYFGFEMAKAITGKEQNR
jgi:hypothetical protein